MSSSEQANLPRFRGHAGTFEIWFLVVFEPGARRAHWLRYEVFSPAAGQPGSPRATLWAAAFDASAGFGAGPGLGAREPVVALKAFLPPGAYDPGSGERFHVRFGDSEIGHGFAKGDVRSTEHAISWDLRFTPAPDEVFRTPRRLHGLPLGTHGHHASTEARFDGVVVVDGVPRELRGAIGTQMHIHGKRRVEELRWLYAPVLDSASAAGGEDRGAMEVVAVRPKQAIGGVQLPGVASVWLRTGDDELDLCDVPQALLNRAISPGTGLLRVSARSATRVVAARAWCDPRTLVGYVYRDPGGQDLFIAQSDVASCEVEVLARPHPLAPLEPRERLTCREGAALELHGTEPLEGVRYIPWDEVDRPRTAARPGSTAPRGADIRRAAGRFEPILAPTAIHAMGLTYRAHVRETSSGGGEAVFQKALDAWLPEGDRVRIPSPGEVLSALDAIEPGLAPELRRRFGFVPAIMDYEVELGMVLLAKVGRRDLEDASFAPEVAFFVANDLTARACQILGEGRPDRMRYWGVAKSFAGFLPVGYEMWIPERRGALPEVTLRTRVNGQVRQEASTAELTLTPREMLERVIRSAGRDLERGEVILTGTPSGVAFQVPAWKRKVADLALDRFGKLRASIAGHAESRAFLQPGDRVEVEAGFLGRREVTLDGP